MYMDPIGGFAWICKYFFDFPKVHFLCVSTAVTNLETCFPCHTSSVYYMFLWWLWLFSVSPPFSYLSPTHSQISVSRLKAALLFLFIVFPHLRGMKLLNFWNYNVQKVSRGVFTSTVIIAWENRESVMCPPISTYDYVNNQLWEHVIDWANLFRILNYHDTCDRNLCVVIHISCYSSCWHFPLVEQKQLKAGVEKN